MKNHVPSGLVPLVWQARWGLSVPLFCVALGACDSRETRELTGTGARDGTTDTAPTGGAGQGAGGSGPGGFAGTGGIGGAGAGAGGVGGTGSGGVGGAGSGGVGGAGSGAGGPGGAGAGSGAGDPTGSGAGDPTGSGAGDPTGSGAGDPTGSGAGGQGAGSGSGAGGQGAGSGSGSGGSGGAPATGGACAPTCSVPADCVSPGSPAVFDVDHYACNAGVCHYLGCQNDAECVSTYGLGVSCLPAPGMGISECVAPCDEPSDCGLSGGPVLFDDNHYECNGGVCEHLGCQTTAECTALHGNGSVCASKPGATIKSCVDACTTTFDCASPGAPALVDQDNYQCVGGACLYLGCLDDSECTSAYGSDWICN